MLKEDISIKSFSLNIIFLKFNLKLYGSKRIIFKLTPLPEPEPILLCTLCIVTLNQRIINISSLKHDLYVFI